MSPLKKLAIIEALISQQDVKQVAEAVDDFEEIVAEIINTTKGD